MVGVGLEGEESSLARVSIVNFYGAVILDEFVKQRERVVDYRTQWSGIRPSDMVHGAFPSLSPIFRILIFECLFFDSASSLSQTLP
jgi:hypothetical protein